LAWLVASGVRQFFAPLGFAVARWRALVLDALVARVFFAAAVQQGLARPL